MILFEECNKKVAAYSFLRIDCNDRSVITNTVYYSYLN